MTEIYCDIVPQPTGWIFTVEGAHSPTFHSYRLALEAARDYQENSSDDRNRIVLREQDLKGQMRRVSLSSHTPAPVAASRNG